MAALLLVGAVILAGAPAEAGVTQDLSATAARVRGRRQARVGRDHDRERVRVGRRPDHRHHPVRRWERAGQPDGDRPGHDLGHDPDPQQHRILDGVPAGGAGLRRGRPLRLRRAAHHDRRPDAHDRHRVARARLERDDDGQRPALQPRSDDHRSRSSPTTPSSPPPPPTSPARSASRAHPLRAAQLDRVPDGRHGAGHRPAVPLRQPRGDDHRRSAHDRAQQDPRTPEASRSPCRGASSSRTPRPRSR